jgi:RNA binding exosome subunit
VSSVVKIEARAYCRATEVPDKVALAINNLYPEEFRELVEFESTGVEGHSGDKIQVLRSELKDKVRCEITLDYIFGKLRETDRRYLHDTLLQRLDENCVFFVRIDKQAAFLDKVVLARGPDVISVQVHIRQYPRCKQDDAIAMLEDHLRVTGGDD